MMFAVGENIKINSTNEFCRRCFLSLLVFYVQMPNVFLFERRDEVCIVFCWYGLSVCGIEAYFKRRVICKCLWFIAALRKLLFAMYGNVKNFKMG